VAEDFSIFIGHMNGVWHICTVPRLGGDV
jgi:hypothetical protein